MIKKIVISILPLAIVLTVLLTGQSVFAAEDGMHDINFTFTNLSEEDQQSKVKLTKTNGMFSFWEEPDADAIDEGEMEAPKFEAIITGYDEADQQHSEDASFTNGKIVAKDPAYDIVGIKINGVDYMSQIQKPWTSSGGKNYYPVPVPDQIASFYNPYFANYVGAPVTIRFSSGSKVSLSFDSFKGYEDISVEIVFAGADAVLFEAKENAKKELDDKYDLTKYSGDELVKLQKAISDAKAAIDAAETVEAVEAARDAGIEEADKVKTDEQIAADTLAAAKSAAKQAIDDKYDLTKYSGEERTKLEKAIADAKTAIDAAETVEAVEAARDAGIEEADKVKTDEQIAADKDAKKAEEIKKKKAAAKKLKVSGLKIKVKSRKFNLTWKKTKGASGYQIQYRKKGAKKFGSLKTTKLKVMTKKLKKNKKYQFRVRTYVKVEGKLVYGKWTKLKTVKCK